MSALANSAIAHAVSLACSSAVRVVVVAEFAMPNPTDFAVERAPFNCLEYSVTMNVQKFVNVRSATGRASNSRSCVPYSPVALNAACASDSRNAC